MLNIWILVSENMQNSFFHNSTTVYLDDKK